MTGTGGRFDPFAGGSLLATGPTTDAQRELLAAIRLGENASLAYNETVHFAPSVNTDTTVLVRALEELYARHEALRATFSSDDEAFFVWDRSLEVERVRATSEEAWTEWLARSLDDVGTRPYDVHEGPLFRAIIVEPHAPSSGCHVILAAHHLAVDGWSFGVLLQELGVIYEALLDGREPALDPPPSFVEYARAQSERASGDAVARNVEYWRRQFDGSVPVVDLPSAAARSKLRTFRADRVDLDVEGEVAERLAALGPSVGTTRFGAYLGGFYAFLNRLTGNRDLVVAVPAAGQLEAGLPGLVGHCVHVLPVRAVVDPAASFSLMARRTGERLMAGLEHREFTVGLLLRSLHLTRDPSRVPLTPIMFNVDRDFEGGLGALEGEATRVRSVPRTSEYFELFVNVVERPGGLRIECQYNADLFPRAVIEEWMRAYVQLMRSAASRPDVGVRELDWVPEETRAAVQGRWNDTMRANDAPATVHGRFERAAQERPAAVAVRWNGGSLTYRALHDQAVHVASALASRGIGSGDLVAVALPRRESLLPALLGVLGSGAAYVPVDLSNPEARIETILRDARPEVVLADPADHERLASSGVPILSLDEVLRSEVPGAGGSFPPEAVAVSDARAYVMHTSGSTGTPKGVEVTHANVVNFLLGMQETLGVTDRDTVLALTTLSFDISVLELFLPLVTGGTCALVERDVAEDPAKLAGSLESLGVTTAQATPSTWGMLREYGWSGDASLRALSGGEHLPRDLADWLLDRVGELWNMYGPTETTVWSAVHKVGRAEGAVPLGGPIRNTWMDVWDHHAQTVPVGVPGEIVVGGEGVALGYLNRPDLTAERFVEAGGVPGGRVYRTGDLGLRDPDGSFRYLGRADGQVKIRGHRIELGEIEAALRAHPSVSDAVAGLHVDARGDRAVKAFVTLDGGADLDLGAVNRHLRDLLPAPMIPRHLMVIGEIPKTAAGKVDRKALPEVSGGEVAGSERVYVRPESEIERAVAEIWGSVLELEKVGLDDDFFDLGGHSILAVRVITRLQRKLAVEMDLRTLFECPNLRAFAHAVEERLGGGGDSVAAPLAAPREGEMEPRRLSLQQERLWYLDRLEGGFSAYNLPGAFSLKGPLDSHAMERALRAFLDAHEMLRTGFADEAGRPAPFIVSEGSPRLSVLDWDDVDPDPGASSAHRDQRIARWLEQEGDREIPLDSPPLVRVILLRLAPLDHILFVVAHHIIWDGWCFDLFLDEVRERYLAALEGRQPDAPVPEATYGDFVRFQSEGARAGARESSEAFWREVLTPPPGPLELPLDHPRPGTLTYAGSRVPLSFGKDELARMHELARGERATVYLVLLAVYQTVLFRWSGQSDLVVASPVQGRSRSEFERVIGFFVNNLPIRIQADRGISFRLFLRSVRDAFLGAIEHQDTPFEWLVQKFAVRDPSRTPLFHAMFTHQHTAARAERWGPLDVASVSFGARTVYADLSFWVREYADKIDGGLDYRTDLFDRESVSSMSAAFRHVMSRVLENPDLALGEIPLLGSERVREETAGREGQAVPSFPVGSWLGAWERALAEKPGAPCVWEAPDAWQTNTELRSRALRLAAGLSERGVVAGDIVGVMTGRGPALPALIAAIHLLDATYLPLDPEFPVARLSWMMTDSGARTLVVDSTTEDDARDLEASPVLLEALESSDPLKNPVTEPASPAYLIYTSGSTGVPKGVQVSHGALANFIRAMAETLEVDPDDVLVAVTTVSFDISFLELLLPLCTGGRLVVAPSEVTRDPLALAELLATTRATVMQATPATWRMLLDQGWAGTLDKILCGGEALPRVLADQLLDRGGEVWNLYGPTETTVWSSADRVRRGERVVPVGRPIQNTAIYVLDSAGHPVPQGVAGEIWIGGAGVADGYRNRPELTAERFRSDPFVPGGRMYATGDLGRWRADGRLEHLGRLDFQVKVAGFRIEPGEIEAVLERLPEVRQAVVVARGAEGDMRLVAYVDFTEGQELLASEIRRALRSQLPRYMIPGVVVPVMELPLTANGKVNRQALPDPLAIGTAESAFEPPATELEKVIASVWSGLLNVEKVGRQDNFFELGGHSLLSIRAVAEVEARAGVRLHPRDFFFRSLEQLAAEHETADLSPTGAEH